MSTARVAAAATLSRPMAFLALTKPDVSFLVVMTTLAGYALGTAGPLDWLRMAQTVLGTTFVAAGSSALNHYLERESDARMRRTAARPLPSGALAPSDALWFGSSLAIIGVIELLVTTNGLAAVLAAATCATYLGLYTPLKTRTTLATLVGAFPGAMPPLIGWAAARGGLGPGAWVLFAVLFLWQFPHFHAIAWMYREDYGRAGILMLPVVDPSGDRTYRLILIMSALLIPVTVLPVVVGINGIPYFFGAFILGILMLQVACWANRARTNVRAKWLMHATVAHIPLLLIWMILDKMYR